MSRIIISKDIERADAARKIPISQSPNNNQGYELHAQAITDDLNMLLWALKLIATDIDGANDFMLLYSSVEAKVVRITPDDLVGVHQNGVVRLSTGEVELGTNPLIKPTILDGDGNDFGAIDLNDLAFTGAGQVIIQFADQADLRGDAGVTVRADGTGGSTVFIGQDDDIVQLGGTGEVNVKGEYRLNASNTPPVTLGSKTALVWDGDGADANPSFQSIGVPVLTVITDTMTASIRHFGTVPTFVDTGDGEYTLTVPSGCILLKVDLEGNNSAGMLNSSTGDLNLIINNSVAGDYLHPKFGLYNKDNDQYISPPGTFANQLVSTPGAAGITTNSFTNLGGFGAPGFIVKLSGF